MERIDYVNAVDVSTAGPYTALHSWMRKHYPKTGRCEWCGTTERRTGYASASHKRYTRNRADWFELCYSCHAAFDGVAANFRGKRRSAQTIDRMSRTLTGRSLTIEHRAHIGAGLKKAYGAGRRPRAITDAQIAELRKRSAAGESGRSLARAYGISQTHVRRLIGP